MILSVRTPLSPTRAILYGALAVGTLDALDAIIFFGLRGAAPARIFQGIASGLLGRASFQGGAATVALGVVCHYTVALGIVSVFFVVSRFIPALARRPFLYGPLYGIVAYLMMNFVVVPLSAAAGGGLPNSVVVFANGILIHIVGVGTPSAWFASRVARPGQTA